MGAAEDHADKIRETAGKSLKALGENLSDFQRLQREWKNEWKQLSCHERLQVAKIMVEKSKDSLPYTYFVEDGDKIAYMAFGAPKQVCGKRTEFLVDSLQFPFEECE